MKSDRTRAWHYGIFILALGLLWLAELWAEGMLK